MKKLYQPQALDIVAHEALFYITNNVDSNDMNKVQLLDSFNKLSAQEKICRRYTHGECFYFAIVAHLILACPIVLVKYGTKTLHYLVEIDDKLMDIEGFVTKEQLATRYKVSKVTLKKNPQITNSIVEILQPQTPEIEKIITEVVDAIYYIKPGVFKKRDILLNALNFINQFYYELDLYNKKEIDQITCISARKTMKNTKSKKI